MHILYIHQHFATPSDSLGTRSYEFAKKLIEAGHSVTMLCGSTAQSIAGEVGTQRIIHEDIAGIQVIRISESYKNSMGFLGRVKAFFGFAFTATRIGRRINADLVFATSTPLTVALPGVLSAKKMGSPLVFEVRDLWPELPVAMGVIRNPVLIKFLGWLERYAYKNSSAVIALAPGIKKGIVSTGFNPAAVPIIPNGCDLDLFTPTPQRELEKTFGDNRSFRAVYCGHHGNANNLGALIDVAKVLKKRNIQDIQFVLIGDGAEKQLLVQSTKDLNLDEYFIWHPPIPKNQLAKVVPKMDVGLMLLKNVSAFQYGTSPNKFFDYLASGIPVINNYPGWVKDLITEHNCGLAVQPDDPEALADSLLELKNNKHFRDSAGQSARQLAESDFSRDKLAAQFVSALEKINTDPHDY
jgi:glycosyltransferase involved in cell wall biosynthesis